MSAVETVLAEVLAGHQRIHSQAGGPCWCGEWPRDEGPRDTWMDHVAAEQASALRALPTGDEGLLADVEALSEDLAARAEHCHNLATSETDRESRRLGGKGNGLGIAHMLAAAVIAKHAPTPPVQTPNGDPR